MCLEVFAVEYHGRQASVLGWAAVHEGEGDSFSRGGCEGEWENLLQTNRWSAPRFGDARNGNPKHIELGKTEGDFVAN
jgi:hypothetical protein